MTSLGRQPRTGVEPRALAVLVGGVIAVSTAASLIRLAEADALAIAAYRMLFATAILLPLSAAKLPNHLRSLNSRERLLLPAAGVFLAIHFALWIASLGMTSVASSVALVTTSPLWVAAAAPALLGQAVSRALAAGIALACLGAMLIGGGDVAVGQGRLGGDLLALGGALAAAGYYLIGARVRPRLHVGAYVTSVYGVAAAVLVAACLATGTPLVGYARSTWLVFFLLGAVPQVLGHSSFNWALSRVSATFVSGAVLGEAVGSTLIAWAVLGEAPPTQAVAGGVMIISGLYVAARDERRGAISSRAAPPT